MSNRSSPTVGHFPPGVSGDALPPPPLPPPPPPLGRLLAPISPRRRDHIAQPPALTTSIPNGFGGGYGSNPTSTTSLSSPFSQNSSSPYGGSAGATTRGISPMATRLSQYSMAYNPQEWAPVSAGAPRSEHGPQSRTIVQLAGKPQADGTLTSPPPPYSPRPGLDGSRVNSSTTLSPADTTYTTGTHSQLTTPPSSTVISPVVPTSGRYVRARPNSMVQMGDHNSARSQGFFAPPPAAPPNLGSRALAKFGLDKLRPQSPIFPSMGGSNQGGPSSHYFSASEANHRPSQLGEMSTMSSYNVPKPPASRRAMSADAAPSGNNSSRATSVDSTDSSRKASWEPGMVLPGPPPGPPPSSFRSQSASAAHPGPAEIMLLPAPRPKNRKAPSLGTNLGPVPPTPADWIEATSSTKPGPLHIDTGNGVSPGRILNSMLPNNDLSSSAPPPEPRSSSGLFRSAAVRDPSAKGLRDRRAASTSRSAVEVGLENPGDESAVSNNPWADSLLSDRPVRLLGMECEESKDAASLRSGDTDDIHTPQTGLTDSQSTAAALDATPSGPPEAKRLSLTVNRFLASPTFSAGSGPSSPVIENNYRRGSLQKNNPVRFRPISHILHTPTDERGLQQPLAPLQIPRSESSSNTEAIRPDSEQFMNESVARHQAFLQNEKLARDDEERLRIFSEYILEESRLRRRRYSKAWASGAFDVRPVKERLFEQTVQNESRSSSISESTAGLSSEPPTPASSSSVQGRPDSTWWSTYQPALSPIASMSNDEVSSRGRTSSRWWESRTGSDSEGQARKLERSKRESKYMGFQRDAIHTGIPEIDSPSANPVNIHEDSEYPAEKADPESYGYYDEARKTPLPTPRAKMPESPSKLDVSRFITLPPPYPRHYPAVNNSHPALVSYRTAVRAYSDLSEVQARKSRCNLSSEALRKDTQQKLAENRRRFRTNIQAQIEEGSISYTEAAEAEEALKLEEHVIEKQAAQAEYDSFQDVVLNPLHDMLNERITNITSCISELKDMLQLETYTLNLDQTQEEGDEEPELLEKLTQLKWLFETREQVHKELYDLLTQRNEKYKAIVLLPYEQAGNAEKLKNTKLFFAQDNQDRQVAYHNECLQRHQDFLKVVDSNVSRGVELLSSTFWDIAPGILDLLQKIPEDLGNWEGILIPGKEYTENPSYVAFPFQYLYSLLSHSEKSTYQFIEAQINLHCLLHEAKSTALLAGYNATDSQRLRDEGGDEDKARLRRRSDLRAQEEADLTAELRQKTSMIEQQWSEALGSQIEGTRLRVKKFLMHQGGWDESIEEED